MTVEMKEKARQELAERLRARYGDDIADRILARDSKSTARARFDEAAQPAPRRTDEEQHKHKSEIMQKAADKKLAAERTQAQQALPACPMCTPETAQVVPWTGNGAGRVTMWHCVSCQGYWEAT